MDQIYITGGGENLPTLIDIHYGKLEDESRAAAQSLFLEANPAVLTNGPYQSNRILFFPEIPDHSLCSVSPGNLEREQIRKHFQELHSDGKAFLSEVLRNSEPGTLESLTDILERYQVLGTTGYVNTFGGGAVGGIVARTSAFGKAVFEVEEALQEYGEAKPMQRGALKPKVHAAYAKLQKKFAADLKAASAKLPAKGRLGYLKSPRQGMKRAVVLAQKGSRSSIVASAPRAQRILNLAKYARRLGNGMLVLDLGLRANNIYQSDNRVRTAVSEGLGLGASFYAGGFIYLKCLGPATALTGPWSLAVCLVPAGGAALVMDEGVKATTGAIYDAIAQ